MPRVHRHRRDDREHRGLKVIFDKAFLVPRQFGRTANEDFIPGQLLQNLVGVHIVKVADHSG